MEKTYSAYHGSKTLKFEHLFEISEHERMDRYRQGNYWQNGKGCSVGCSVQPEDINIDFHAYLESVYDVPKSVYQLGDSIFEGLPVEDSKTWTMRYSSAMTEGIDYSFVWPKFAHWMLADERDGIINVTQDLELRNNIQIIADSLLFGTENSPEAVRAVKAVGAAGAEGVAWAVEAARVARIVWAVGAVGAAVAQKQAKKLVEIIKNG